MDDYLRAIQSIIKQNDSRGSDIASASTIAIPNSGKYFVVTGTTTINAISDSWTGRTVFLKFSGSLTVTNSASIVIPGGANIVTSAGDCLTATNESSGVWRITLFQQGSSLTGGGSNVESQIHAASTKATPVNADEFPLVDSASAWGLKKFAWSDIKAALKTYFDTLYLNSSLFGSSSLKTGAYTVVSGDKGVVLKCSGTFTLSLTAAATLGDGFVFEVYNTGGGTITIDPNGAEIIDNASTKDIPANTGGIIYCDGSKFLTFGIAQTAGVTSVNGNTGAITASQISAAATTGYGYTPASIDTGSGGVGAIVLAVRASGSTANGATASAASLTLAQADFSTGALSVIGSVAAGTWRNISGIASTTSGNSGFIWQRIS